GRERSKSWRRCEKVCDGGPSNVVASSSPAEAVCYPAQSKNSKSKERRHARSPFERSSSGEHKQGQSKQHNAGEVKPS
ncbi:MAG: hypothetical protein ABSF12_11960, partial [Bryobacteraceae bacterium]